MHVDGPVDASARWSAIGTTVRVLVAEPAYLASAAYAVAAVVNDVDVACSRFRADSELMRLCRAGVATEVSPLLAQAIEAALDAAKQTDGAVDPTGGASIRALGYDRSFDDLGGTSRTHAASLSAGPYDPPGPAFAGWELVRLDPRTRTVCMPRGVELDLGATAKGLAADLAAHAAAGAADGTGVLVSLGGDLSVAGATPSGGWAVKVADDHRAPLDTTGPTIAVHSGGLATSSTTVRRWTRGETTAHHVLDPATGRSTTGPWRTVTAAAASCLEANVATTAAIVMGAAAPAWLEAHHIPARLVGADGQVVLVGGWPADEQPVEPAPVGPATVEGSPR
ncbi:MAG TPA: FAD:protein FMN transferase [Acidimicrobiales bacterium]|jgi:thiamine biosynthesis lipoprotein|nr:FAD:protein FMN transferase [Acidimicrobiales bacterium]